jgi:histidine ammonia-lyase
MAGALALEGFRANLSPLDTGSRALRPVPGHRAGVVRLRALMAGSDLLSRARRGACRTRSPSAASLPSPGHAVRCRRGAGDRSKPSLASAPDSPAVLVERDAMLSSVNFDTTELALTLEAAGLALSHLAATSAARIVKLMSPG